MESLPLYEIGNHIFKTFAALVETEKCESTLGPRPELITEEQRFRLWAHSLGLSQTGHASLDYRIRDAPIVKRVISDVLIDLKDHIDSLLSIARGVRRPYEENTDCLSIDVDMNSTDSSNGNYDAISSLTSSDTSSYHEIDFRYHSIGERLDALYSLATKIRNPRNRPQRTIDQLYSHIPSAYRDSYIKEREEAEIAIISYGQRDQVEWRMGESESNTSPSNREHIVSQYVSKENWLIRRAGLANARRKQQFVYWRGHALRLGQGIASANDTNDMTTKMKHGASHWYLSGLSAPSLATSATKLLGSFTNSEDLLSVISHTSRHSDAESTALEEPTERLEWPGPPVQYKGTDYFLCPCCRILCPKRYLSKDAWRYVFKQVCTTFLT
jgi:hypothetical protein